MPVLLVAGIVIIAWLPVAITYQISPPKEESEYIRRVFGGHTVGQLFYSEQPISAWEVYLRSEQPQTALVRVSDENGTVQQEKTVSLESTDQPVRFWLAQPLPPGEHTLTLSTSPSIDQGQAILVRYQPYSQAYDAGEMIIDRAPSYGDVGFRLIARVPVWKGIVIIGQITDKAAWRGLVRFTVAMLMGGVLWGFGYLIQRSQRPQRWIAALLLSVAFFTVALRLPYLTIIEGVFGGDAFNYLSKAQALLEGNDPFTADARKGPMFSAFLIPGFFTPDPLLWSRLMGIAAATAAVILLTFILREFGMRWELAATGGLLLAVNQDFIWESPNGLANSLYVALILAVALAFLKRSEGWMAVLLGLTFLTRYEAAVMVPVFWAATWWRERLSWKRAAALLLVTLAVMSIPQVSYIWSSGSGIRTAGDVLDDEGLGLARSLEAGRYNLGRFHLFLRNVWLRSETPGGVLLPFGVGLVAGAAWLASQRWRPRWLRPFGAMWSGLWLAALLILLFTKSSEVRVWLVAAPFFLMGLGMAPWFRARRFDVGIILLALLAHTAVIIQILPKARYFLPLIPFMALSMIFGLQQLLSWDKKAPLLGAALLMTVLISDGRVTLQRRAERYNTYAAEVNVMIQAVAYLRRQHGNVGFYSDGEQAMMTFIPEQRRFLWQPKAEQVGVAGEQEFIRTHALRYLVERAGSQEWQIVRRYPNLFEHAHTFDSIYGESKVEVYRAHPERLVAE